MDLFTSKAVLWRRRIQNDNASRLAYQQLSATIGEPQAKKFLETVYDKWVNVLKDKIDYLAPDTCSQFMQQERENFTNCMQYVNSLFPQANDGTLGTILNANLRNDNNYYTHPTPGFEMTLRNLAIDQAANWVCGDFVAAIPKTRRLLEHYIPRNPAHHGETGNPALGTTPHHLRKIFKRAVRGVAPYRIVFKPVKYPSTVGGSVALERIFDLTSGMNVWPAFGDALWDSIAMFYLVSIVHVQAFPDGNKRTGHLAYAIVLIKGTHTFKAPTTAKEKELFRMKD